jgi:hypothetical protein
VVRQSERKRDTSAEGFRLDIDDRAELPPEERVGFLYAQPLDGRESVALGQHHHRLGDRQSIGRVAPGARFDDVALGQRKDQPPFVDVHGQGDGGLAKFLTVRL